MSIWLGLGTLTTASHGLLATITAPAWAAGGVPALIHAALTNDLKVKPAAYGYLYQYARFPGGIPPHWRVPARHVGRPPAPLFDDPGLILPRWLEPPEAKPTPSPSAPPASPTRAPRSLL
jgi:hypothetical protein